MPGRRAVGLLEGFENPLLPVQGDADPRVADGELNHHPVACVAHEFAPHGHLPLGSELEGVADEVDEHLAQAYGVAAHPRRDAGRQDGRKIKPLLLCPQGKTVRDVANELREVKGRFLQHHLSRLDLGQVEDVADQSGEIAGFAVDGFQEPLDLFIGILPQAKLRHPDDPVQGSADLVAHLGQELALGAAGDLGGLFVLDQGLRPLSLRDVPRHRLDADDQAVALGGDAHLRFAPERAAVLPDVLQHQRLRKPLAGESLLLDETLMTL